MSAADPFLPAPATGVEPEDGTVPDDDGLAGDVEDDTDRVGRTDPARPARFDTPRPGDRLDEDDLRRDLDAG